MAMRVEARTRSRPRRAVRAAASATVLCAWLAGAAGCALPGEADVDQADPETVRTEVDVKRALLGSDAVGGAAIGVEVGDDGTVTLGGFVGSEAERDEALRLAREALGGREPVDALEVRD